MTADAPTLIVLPFATGTRSADEAVNHLRTCLERLAPLGYDTLLVLDGGHQPDLADAPRPTASLHLERNVGKIAAARSGLRLGLEMSQKYESFAIVDFDDEQDQRDVTLMIARLPAVDAVIADRYGHFARADIPEHRLVANDLNVALGTALGRPTTDLAAAMAACNRNFAKTFVRESVSDREGVGFDWLVLAYLHGHSIGNVAVHATMRSGQTSGQKLSRNYAIPLNYAHALHERGAGDVVRFCQTYTTALNHHHETVPLPLALLGAAGNASLVRVADGNYAYQGHITPPSVPRTP